MKNIILLMGAFILSCQDVPKKNTTELTSSKTEKMDNSKLTNWTSLFDGKTFNGWSFGFHSK